ncbi:MAG: hypothetical protein RIM99_19030 [Cyclobacteriaceae bacterium]
MKDRDFFEKNLSLISKLIIVIASLVFVVFAMLFYYSMDPKLTAFKRNKEPETSPLAGFDTIENGIHLRTGLIDGEGLMSVVNNCTNCHSAQLVIQNRMNKERWVETIRWMQRTQNLWDLGEQEETIINYLVTNYPPTQKGRRANLSNIEWYELED